MPLDGTDSTLAKNAPTAARALSAKRIKANPKSTSRSVKAAPSLSEWHVWMAPALQDIFEMIGTFVRSSHVSGLFAR
ncbi:hypothetical protein, partial [Pseudovibrio sp. POLY-S9]|uniref:hypothetical protein n=1 Tax=Pseudovibrio sp. POLY-S9 TaxID=1576596 RepID=UPI000B06F30D